MKQDVYNKIMRYTFGGDTVCRVQKSCLLKMIHDNEYIIKVFTENIYCEYKLARKYKIMRTWYIYRTRRSFMGVFTPMAGNVSFRFRKDRKSFDYSITVQDEDPSTAKDYIFYWRDTAPITFEQLMIEAELTRKYKA